MSYEEAAMLYSMGQLPFEELIAMEFDEDVDECEHPLSARSRAPRGGERCLDCGEIFEYYGNGGDGEDD